MAVESIAYRGIKTDYVIHFSSCQLCIFGSAAWSRSLSSLSSRAIKDGDSGGEQAGAEHGDPAQK